MLNPRQVDVHFNKAFKFTNNEKWALPSEAYKSPAWEIESLQEMKVKLNEVKGQLSKFNLVEWSKYTKYRDPSSFIISTMKTKAKIEVLTQAWCKFYECLNRYPIIPVQAQMIRKLSSLHLCEAPGGFVSALNYFLYTNYRPLAWYWAATTLNPYYEGNDTSYMISDDRLIKYTYSNWDFGLDLTGDLTKYYNHKVLVEQYSEVLLVTADGSVDCMSNPGEQESILHFLHYCEVMTALKVLKPQGSFVLKLFTMFEYFTICLLYLLTCTFENVHVLKPCASKSGNSEVYAVCLGYKGIALLSTLWNSLIDPYQHSMKPFAMFALSEIDTEFLKQLEECAALFMNFQCLKINDNVKHFQSSAYADYEEVDELKWRVAEEFIQRYAVVSKLPKRKKLIKGKTDIKFNKNIGTENLLNIKIGKAIEVVTFTQFTSVDINMLLQLRLSVTDILQELEACLFTGFTLIQKSDFQEQEQYYIFQRYFFSLLRIQLQNSCNVVIFGIPLLTKFLVGLLYILSLGFESVFVKKQALVFYNANKVQLRLIQSYFDIIDSVHNNLEIKHFVADILEVVPNKLLDNSEFYSLICKYNDGLLLS